MYKVRINESWVIGEPVDGEICRFYPIQGSDTYIESIYYEKKKANKIVITSHEKRAVVAVGSELTVNTEIQDGDGNKLPFNDSFAMPVGRAGGLNYRTLMMEFVDGVCSKKAQWNDAGEFEITKEMINMHLNESEKLDFDGFNISVAE